MADPMRLVVYTEADIVAGAEISLANLLEHLDPSVQVTVAGTHPATLETLAARRPGTRIAHVPHIGGKFDVLGVARVALAFRRMRPDILQVTLPTPWACRHALLVATLMPGLRVVAVEQLPTPAPDVWQRAIKRFTTRRLAGHVSVGERAAREVEEAVGLPHGAVGVIHNGVSPPAEPLGSPPGEGRFGTMARLNAQKGIEDWLQALQSLPEARADIVGDGSLRASLEARAEELGLDGRVHFRGWSTDAGSWLRRWDAFVLPSHFEGFPLAMVEAMLHGLPVIATDVGSVSEAISDGETGLLVPPWQPDALAAAARRLAGDPELARRLGEAGRARAQERFTAAAMARGYERLYARVLEGRATSAPRASDSARLRLHAAAERALRDMTPGRRLRTRLAARRLAEELGPGPMRLLDAGCEVGLLSLALAARRPAWAIEAVDIDERWLTVGRGWAAEAGVTIDFHYADLTQGLPAGRYDAIAALECLAEIPDANAALEAMAGALRPGGMLALHVPQADWRPALPGSPATWDREVRHGFDRPALEAALERLGLDVTHRRDTMRTPVQAAHELRDRIKRGPLPLRLAVLPLLSLAVTLELRGIGFGPARGIYLEARRPS
jgi:glycosyltransferase involved in cell wall biosynthesis/SAM-dependent methyltransferase